MKYYIIAGEASGDLHASNLMKAILQKDQNAEFRFWGGDLMAKVAGEKPVKHYKELAFMGFLEVAMNLRTILKNIKATQIGLLCGNFKICCLMIIMCNNLNFIISGSQIKFHGSGTAGV